MSLLAIAGDVKATGSSTDVRKDVQVQYVYLDDRVRRRRNWHCHHHILVHQRTSAAKTAPEGDSLRLRMGPKDIVS